MISCKNVRGRILSYTPAPETEVYLNQVRIQSCLARLPCYPYARQLETVLRLHPGLYHLATRGGGEVSRLALVPYIICRYHRSSLNSKGLLKSLQKVLVVRKSFRYPKRYGGPSSRARYQKSYR